METYIEYLTSSIKKSILFIEKYISKRESLLFHRERMKEATTYNSWKKHAIIVDDLENKAEWKSKKQSSLYDYLEVEQALIKLRQKREMKDIQGHLSLLSTLLVKNIYSINSSYLYSYCNYSTKDIINDFLNQVHSDLDYILKLPEDKLPLMKKLDFFNEAKHSYGRTALMLSGGAIFGLYHIGIIVTLLENNLLPQVICGSSVGSIIAGAICCLDYNELLSFLTRRHEDYDGPFHLKNYNDGLFKKIFRLVTCGAVREIEVLKDYLRELYGDITFKEAYLKTGRILNVSVTGYKEHDHSKILNYITSPNVLVFSACAASSASPILFKPSELLYKNEYGQIVPLMTSYKIKKYIDGSLSADIPMKRLGELFNVNTFIVSQVNPWVIPFLDEEDEKKNFFKRKKLSIWTLMKKLIISEIRHRIKQVQGVLSYPYSIFLNLITQDYVGDITIFPEFCFKDLLHLVSNPTGLDFHRFKINGNKRVFQKICLIESTVKTELILEKCFLKLKSKLQKQVLSSKVKSYLKDDFFENETRKEQVKSFYHIYSQGQGNFDSQFNKQSQKTVHISNTLNRNKDLNRLNKDLNKDLFNNEMVFNKKGTYQMNSHFRNLNVDFKYKMMSVNKKIEDFTCEENSEYITNDYKRLEFYPRSIKNQRKNSFLLNSILKNKEKPRKDEGNQLKSEKIKGFEYDFELNDFDLEENQSINMCFSEMEEFDSLIYDDFSRNNTNKHILLKNFNNSELNLKLLEEISS